MFNLMYYISLGNLEAALRKFDCLENDRYDLIAECHLWFEK